MITMRVKFKKGNELKYIGHLDLMRLFQRSLSRANIPVGYSQGFNPHPKFNFATALALGVPSEGEYMDVELTEDMSPNDFKTKLNGTLPQGIEVLKCDYYEGKDTLMATMRWATYIAECSFNQALKKEDIEQVIEQIMADEEILVTKTKKKKNRIKRTEVNIRPLIRDISLIMFETDHMVIKTTLKTGSQGNLKPELLMAVMGEKYELPIIDDSINIQRLELYLEEDGKLTTPL